MAFRTEQDLHAAADRIRREIQPGQSIAFVSGNFNVVHPGHLRLLKFAKDVGNILVVAVNPDDTAGVTVPAVLRLEGVRSIAMIDHALLLNGSPSNFISILRPDFVVKGKEFESAANPEQGAVDAYGGRLVFSSGEMRFTSIAMLQREYSDADFSSVAKPLDYPMRHGFQVADLKSALAKFSGLRALVVGDLIVDEYITCDPLGMSQEDPTIVVTPVDKKTFVGGAGVVAAHARGLGAEVHYCTVTGEDESADFAVGQLDGLGVTQTRLVDPTRPTTRKQRYRALNKTLLRVNHLRQHPISPEIQSAMLAAIEARLEYTDLILFSCFNYGCLPQDLVNAVTERAAERKILMAADSQASSQMGDISRFRGMALVTPTEREARMALNDYESGLAVIGNRLQERAHADNLMITLGAEGLLVYGLKDGEYLTDRLPAFNKAPKDVAGAGDSLFTCASLGLRVGLDIWESAYIGALASALQVSRVGNAPLMARDIVAEIDAPNGSNRHSG